MAENQKVHDQINEIDDEILASITQLITEGKLISLSTPKLQRELVPMPQKDLEEMVNYLKDEIRKLEGEGRIKKPRQVKKK